VDIQFTYVVADANYRSNRYDVCTPGHSSSGIGHPQAEEEIVRRYPFGSATFCYVNPLLPNEALLQRGWPSGLGFPIGISLFFILVGAGGMCFAVRSGRIMKKTARARQLYPDKPWMWRDDWAIGQVKSTTRSLLLILWEIAVFSNLLSLPVLTLVPGEIARKGDKMLYIAFVFPLIGFGLLAGAIWATVRRLKFGNSVFAMLTVPAALGGALAGTIRLGRPRAALGEVKLRLVCSNCVTTGSEKTSSRSETVLWANEQTMPPGTDNHVPILFALPADGRETDMRNLSDSIVWRLEARSSVPGIDYSAQFDVPVFRAEFTPEQARLGQAACDHERIEVEQYQPSPTSRIHVHESPHGGMEFYFPAPRHLLLSIVQSVCLVIFMGGLWALIHFHVQVMVAGFVVLFASILAPAAFCSCFRAVRVTADATGITVTNNLRLFTLTRVIPSSDIEEIRVNCGMHDGIAQYHDIKIICQSGRVVTAGNYIRDKQEADWLARRMAHCIGKEPTP